MANRKLNVKKINFLSLGIGGKILIEDGSIHELADMVLRANEFGTLYLERPDGTIYAKQCTNCGNMYELKTSFHRARRNDGSTRYHSHCAECRRKDIKEYTNIRELKAVMQELDKTDTAKLQREIGWIEAFNDIDYQTITVTEALNLFEACGYAYPSGNMLISDKMFKALHAAEEEGFGDCVLAELLFRYARGIENLDNDTCIRQAANVNFINYLITGLTSHLENGGALPTIEELFIKDLATTSVNPMEPKAAAPKFDSIKEDCGTAEFPPLSDSSLEIKVEDITLEIGTNGSTKINLKGLNIKTNMGEMGYEA